VLHDKIIAMFDVVEKAMISGLNATEQATLLALLDKIARAVDG